MTDIVEWLRNVFPIGWEGEMRHKAADEIERLRAALRELLADTQHAAHACGDPDCPVDRARALLEDGR